MSHRPVLVVDFGAQYAQLIARRVREARVYSEIVPHTMSAADMLAKNPAAIILSGGPSSVYEAGAPSLDPAILEAGVPVLGICYGFQAMAAALGGDVARTGQREYGGTDVAVCEAGVLLAGSPDRQSTWMSHGDAVHAAPEGFTVLASSAGAPVAAFEDASRPALRRAVAPRGQALRARPGRARAVPLRRRRSRTRLDPGQRHCRAG